MAAIVGFHGPRAQTTARASGLPLAVGDDPPDTAVLDDDSLDRRAGLDRDAILAGALDELEGEFARVEVAHVRSVRRPLDGGAHVSVDALGIAATCRNSVYGLRRRGTHVQIGLTTEAEGGGVALPTDLMVHNEFTIVASKGMPPARYDEIFRMVAAGKLDPGAVVTETASLDGASETLTAMTDYGTYGVLVITEF